MAHINYTLGRFNFLGGNYPLDAPETSEESFEFIQDAKHIVYVVDTGLNSYPLNTYPLNDQPVDLSLQAESVLYVTDMADCACGHTKITFTVESTAEVGQFLEESLSFITEATGGVVTLLEDTSLNSYTLNDSPVNSEPALPGNDSESDFAFEQVVSFEAIAVNTLSFDSEAVNVLTATESFNFVLSATGSVEIVIKDTSLNSYPVNSYPVNSDPLAEPNDSESLLSFEQLVSYEAIAVSTISFSHRAMADTVNTFTFELDAARYIDTTANDSALNSYPLNSYPVNDSPAVEPHAASSLVTFDQYGLAETTSAFTFTQVVTYATEVAYVEDTALNSYPLNSVPVNSVPELVYPAEDYISFTHQAIVEQQVTTEFSFVQRATSDTVSNFSFEDTATRYIASTAVDTGLNSYPLNDYPVNGKPLNVVMVGTNLLTFEQDSKHQPEGLSSFSFEQDASVQGLHSAVNDYSFENIGNIVPDAKDSFTYSQTVTWATEEILEDTALNSYPLGSYLVNDVRPQSITYAEGLDTLTFVLEPTYEVLYVGNNLLTFESEHTYFVGHAESMFSFVSEAEVDSPIQRAESSFSFTQETTNFVGRIVESSFSFTQEVTKSIAKNAESLLEFDYLSFGPPDGQTSFSFEVVAEGNSLSTDEGSLTFLQETNRMSVRAVGDTEAFVFAPIAVVYRVVDSSVQYAPVKKANNLFGVDDDF